MYSFLHFSFFFLFLYFFSIFISLSLCFPSLLSFPPSLPPLLSSLLSLNDLELNCVDQTGLKLREILLPLPSELWDRSHSSVFSSVRKDTHIFVLSQGGPRKTKGRMYTTIIIRFILLNLGRKEASGIVTDLP